jgi:hypothetical protein
MTNAKSERNFSVACARATTNPEVSESSSIVGLVVVGDPAGQFANCCYTWAYANTSSPPSAVRKLVCGTTLEVPARVCDEHARGRRDWSG